MTSATAGVGDSAHTDFNALSDYWERRARELVGRGFEETGK
ncbi:MAG: hypothetical protein P8L46_16475 [Acidimicrobiales bacterium]|nr:hypothetical protein [Acidimicrobiales bacterium]MDG2219637.1 hypothetical protein [Acidimicrobiales bacterium]